MHRIDLIEQLARERQQQLLAEAAQRRQAEQLSRMGRPARRERGTWAEALQRALEDVWAIGLRNKPQF